MPAVYDDDDDDDDDRDHPQAMIDWLSDKSPDVWFDVTRHLNWDNSHRVLDWIVSQPTCERANAALIFWGCDPFYYLRNPDRDHIGADGHDLMAKILHNWSSGFYQRRELAFDKNYRLKYFELLEKLPGRVDPFDIPNDLLGPIHGRAPNVPPHLSAYNNAELRKLLSDLGTDIGYAPGSKEARRIERPLKRAAILHFYEAIFGSWVRSAVWMLPAGALVIA